MSDTIRVRDRRTDIIRTVTRKAYMALGPKVYEKLGPEEAVETTPPVIDPPSDETPTEAPETELTEETGSDAPAESIAAPAKKRPGRPARVKSISSDSAEDEK